MIRVRVSGKGMINRRVKDLNGHAPRSIRPRIVRVVPVLIRVGAITEMGGVVQPNCGGAVIKVRVVPDMGSFRAIAASGEAHAVCIAINVLLREC